jgi:hypothetical protein
MLTNLARLWVPMARTIVLNAIQINGNIIREEPEQSLDMGRAWQPTYNLKDFSDEDADVFLENI